MNLKFLPFAIGMSLVSTGVNAETFEEVSADKVSTESLKATEANLGDVTINEGLNMTTKEYGLNLGISKTGSQYYSNFIECKDYRIGAYNTMFSVSEKGYIAGTGLCIKETSANHTYSPALGIYFDNKENLFSFSTSSYPGTASEKYYPISFKAEKYLFNKGDMVVDGKITCREELNVVAINTSNINTNDINVNMSNVADYVFDEDYDLKSLSEVESYVKENKHLPGIPSAAEIEQNGVSLSKMSNMLLEKVEELTLHLIRLEKENAELKAKFESLEK